MLIPYSLSISPPPRRHDRLSPAVRTDRLLPATERGLATRHTGHRQNVRSVSAPGLPQLQIETGHSNAEHPEVPLPRTEAGLEASDHVRELLRPHLVSASQLPEGRQQIRTVRVRTTFRAEALPDQTGHDRERGDRTDRMGDEAVHEHLEEATILERRGVLISSH